MISLLIAIAFAHKELAYNPEDVKDSIRDILMDPLADNGNYGPFLIRLAWHCAGTYQRKTGRGGCDGARIRFDVERTWGDNAGLIPGPHEDPGVITALSLLAPIKAAYKNDLSWGDLIVLAGSTSIEELGGPQIDFCGGRVDAYEGYSLEELNVDMIYVVAGDTSAAKVRTAFDGMDMNDQETVALIGGGHAFGRCHASRSGFDGPWTSEESMFDNEFFKLLKAHDEHNIYVASEDIAGQYNYDSEDKGRLIMLHGDLVLLDDPDFKKWVYYYAHDEHLLRKDFKAGWEKLMNRDMGLRPCAGDIPVIPQNNVDYDSVKNDVLATIPDATLTNDFETWGPLYVRLAWHCSGTYRTTDHLGGCNGARIRHDPEASWGSNADVHLALERLQPIYNKYHGLSWADLIIIAGTSALETMGALPMPFCPGRTDVTAEQAAVQSRSLDEEIYLNPETATASLLRDSMKIMGFTDRDMVVLNGGGHAIGSCHASRSGFSGPWTSDPTSVSNSFFNLLLSEEWQQAQSDGNRLQYHNSDETLTMLVTDIIFRDDDRFRAIVEEYAYDNDLFLADFRDAWVKLVNNDRFGDVCVTNEEPECDNDGQNTKMETSFEPHDTCRLWCFNSAQPWSVRCNFLGCLGCPLCGTITLEAKATAAMSLMALGDVTENPVYKPLAFIGICSMVFAFVKMFQCNRKYQSIPSETEV